MNKYLHTVASVGFLFTLNYDAQNHELKILINGAVNGCDCTSNFRIINTYCSVDNGEAIGSFLP